MITMMNQVMLKFGNRETNSVPDILAKIGGSRMPCGEEKYFDYIDPCFEDTI